MTEFEVQTLKEMTRVREILERRHAAEPNLLRAIHSATRGLELTTADLVRHAELHANSDLQTALECKFGEPNSRRIGKFLASITGHQIDGFIVEPIGSERGVRRDGNSYFATEDGRNLAKKS